MKAICQINESNIGKNSTVVNSVIDKSTIQDNGNIGPFAHIRPGSELGEGVKVGSFAETKKLKIGKGSKAIHRSRQILLFTGGSVQRG